MSTIKSRGPSLRKRYGIRWVNHPTLLNIDAPEVPLIVSHPCLLPVLVMKSMVSREHKTDTAGSLMMKLVECAFCAAERVSQPAPFLYIFMANLLALNLTDDSVLTALFESMKKYYIGSIEAIQQWHLHFADGKPVASLVVEIFRTVGKLLAKLLRDDAEFKAFMERLKDVVVDGTSIPVITSAALYLLELQECGWQ